MDDERELENSVLSARLDDDNPSLIEQVQLYNSSQ